jgi:hypothetical protein
MDITYSGILTLIKSCLVGQALPLPEGFSLEAAGRLIHSHSLGPMAYKGGFLCGFPGKSQAMQRLQVDYFRSVVRSDKQLRAAQELYDLFEERGIDYLPLKGCNLKRLYPDPALRVMGDADILIRQEQYERIKPMMVHLGYRDAGESHYDYSWDKPELYVELHRRLFSETQVDLCGYFGDGWSRAVKTAGHRYDFTPEDEYVYVFTHMAKHFRFCGIGVRQLVDLYVYRKARPELNEDSIRQAMRRLKLLDFYINIEQMLRVWFEGEEEDETSLLMTEYIFASGNWGTVENKMYSEELLKAQHQGGVKHSKMRSIFTTIFPPLRLIRVQYTVLYKWPVLYPVMLVVRWFDVLLHKRGHISQKVKVIQGMSDEKVLAHQQAMLKMGLTFDYGDEV